MKKTRHLLPRETVAIKYLNLKKLEKQFQDQYLRNPYIGNQMLKQNQRTIRSSWVNLKFLYMYIKLLLRFICGGCLVKG